MRRSISLPPPLQQLRRCACVSGALLEHPPRVPRHPLNFGNGYQVPIRRSVLRINSNQLQNTSFSQTSQFLWQSDLSTYKRNKIHIHLYHFFGSWSMQSWAQPLFQEKFCTCSVEFTTMSLHTTVLLRHGTRDNMYYGHPHNHNLCSSEQQLKAGRFLLTSLFRCLPPTLELLRVLILDAEDTGCGAIIKTRTSWHPGLPAASPLAQKRKLVCGVFCNPSFWESRINSNALLRCRLVLLRAL